MMRAPMSRMDILTDTEIKALLDKSVLKAKYNEVIDRESAYEILNAKIANEAPKEDASKKTETKSTAPKTSSAPKKSTAQNPIIKMLTSATFVRGVFGVLSKLMKK